MDDISPPKSLWAMRATDGGLENSQHAENISVTVSGTTGGDRQRSGSAQWWRGERWHSAADLRRMAARGGGAVGGGAAAHCDSLVRRRRLRISRLGEDRAARGKERRPPRDFSSTKFFVQVRGAYSILHWPNHNKPRVNTTGHNKTKNFVKTLL